jgi:hypothetical protein
MRQAILLSALIAASSVLAPSDALAQPAEAEPLTTEPADESADGEIELSDFAFGANIRGSLIHAPTFVLDGFFSLYQGHWEDRAKFGFGGEFVVRYLNRHDLILGIEYQDYSTPAGLWLEEGDPLGSANFVENSLSLISLLIEYEWFARFLPDDSLHVFVGAGAGVSFVNGEVRTYELNPACIEPLDDGDVEALGALRRDVACGDNPDNDDLVLGYTDEEERLFSDKEDVPSVLPAFKLTFGLRYMIKERGVVALEGGIFNAAFYIGLEAGFMIPMPKRGESPAHAGGLRSAEDGDETDLVPKPDKDSK